MMDYWCSLWFWDVRDAKDLPNRQQYWQDIAAILELDLNAVDVNEAVKKTTFYCGRYTTQTFLYRRRTTGFGRRN
ncbi:MAG: hypothetical protein IPG86_19635 [Chitinophagaceae bacterium]|nr:hypothetical protein [Chitinophagaceae bacterium]